MAQARTPLRKKRAERLDDLLRDIAVCRVCRDAPLSGHALPHEPRPVLRAAASARLGIFGQAPGTRVHASGVPFSDPSGVRLRQWMGVSDAEFYDCSRVAVVPMGFCFPGQDAKGADLPPRTECAKLWRARVMAALPNLRIVLLVGGHAQRWHLGPAAKGRPLGDIVAAWQTITERHGPTQMWPLPHPSWRNNAWLKKNSWFDEELVPCLQRAVRGVLDAPEP